MIGVTTFKKNKALDVMLGSMLDYGYDREEVVIACGNRGEAREVFDKYRDRFSKLALCYGKSRGGIAKNKNRLIRYFLEFSKEETVLLLDDDIQFIAPGLLEKIKEASDVDKQEHITLLWTDPGETIDQISGRKWFEDFPVRGASEHLTWHLGSHGVGLWFNRRLMEKLGYYNKFNYIYGYEHSAISCRAMVLQKFATNPELHPILKNCEKYFVGQQIPNDYEVSRDEFEKHNAPEYARIVSDAYLGKHLKVTNHWLSIKEEKVVTNQ
jgi:glycosyltransferase involved in cell wall biosynthesis